MWAIARATITMGKRKCKAKKRVSVGLSTETLPQIQEAAASPTVGMAENNPVITEAPQKDICPQGRT